MEFHMKNGITKMLRYTILSAAVLGAGVLGMEHARASIMISPTQVVFEGRDRFATITLINNSNSVKSYEMGWVYMQMQSPTGTYQIVDMRDKGYDLSKFIDFAPRRVSLQPGEKQKVRVALRRSESSLPDGDYIAHIEFKAMPSEEELALAEEVLILSTSYTIPVTIRYGVSTVLPVIQGLALNRDVETGMLTASVTVGRSGGNYASLNHLYVYHVGDDDQETLVGEVANANIFPEISERIFKVILKKEITGGALRVVLRDTSEKGSEIINAEKVYPLQ